MKRLMMLLVLAISVLVLLLGGCGGGGSDSAPTTVSGVAAAGSPLSGTVYLKDASLPAKELSAPIGSDGSFMFDVTGLTPPYLLKASGTVNQVPRTLYSLSPFGGIVNINPLTHLATVMAHGSDTLDLVYNNLNPLTLREIRFALNSAVQLVQTALRPTLERFGAAGADFISSSYVANHRGLDLFFDLVSVTINSGTVTLHDKLTHSDTQRPLGQFAAGIYDIVTSEVPSAGTLYVMPEVNYVSTEGSCSFFAFVVGSQSRDFTWSVVEDGGGSVTSDGVYTAPLVPGVYHVKVTSNAEPAKSREVTVTVTAKNGIKIISPAPGEYTVLGESFYDIGGCELEISYDSATLANPRITKGALTENTMFVTIPDFGPNKVKVSFITLAGIIGSGSLATVSFDLKGPVPGPVVISRKLLATLNGTQSQDSGSLDIITPYAGSGIDSSGTASNSQPTTGSVVIAKLPVAN